MESFGIIRGAEEDPVEEVAGRFVAERLLEDARGYAAFFDHRIAVILRDLSFRGLLLGAQLV